MEVAGDSTPVLRVEPLGGSESGLVHGLYARRAPGNTCLAGDVWGAYDFPAKLQVGDFVIFDNAARYTMVKMNWFNGVQMPSIVVRRLDGKIELARKFEYVDYRKNLS